ncbi:MAG: hypothetical protein M2R45_03908 [Verrucomicrobia subdivision 3 bacterium]|nr:hypothetical protein [Limisphaerales bacterium]MCS1417511.1 hypothetical protein [Limisphaerales bacterium]
MRSQTGNEWTGEPPKSSQPHQLPFDNPELEFETVAFGRYEPSWNTLASDRWIVIGREGLSSDTRSLRMVYGAGKIHLVSA